MLGMAFLDERCTASSAPYQEFQADLIFVHCLSPRCFLELTGSQALTTGTFVLFTKLLTLSASLSNATHSLMWQIELDTEPRNGIQGRARERAWATS